MVGVADRVVHARVAGSRIYWEAPGRILTETTGQEVVLFTEPATGGRRVIVGPSRLRGEA